MGAAASDSGADSQQQLRQRSPRAKAPQVEEGCSLLYVFACTATTLIVCALAAAAVGVWAGSIDLRTQLEAATCTWRWAPPEHTSFSLQQLGDLAIKSGLLFLACLAVQAALYTLFRNARKPAEKAFFFTSVAVRFVWVFTVERYHRLQQPSGGAGATVKDDLPERSWVMALFFAGYGADMVLLSAFPESFGQAFQTFMMKHHMLSVTFIAVWLLTVAPAGPAGAIMQNTMLIYLNAVIWNHSYKLVRASLRVSWLGWLGMPAAVAHWVHLLGANAYFFQNCAATPLGCCNPASAFIFVGAYGMACFDVLPYLRAIKSEWDRRMDTPHHACAARERAAQHARASAAAAARRRALQEQEHEANIPLAEIKLLGPLPRRVK